MKKRPPYLPLPGSVAATAIEHLKTLEQGFELSTHALAQAIGQVGDNFGQYLSAAVRADMLRRRIEGGLAFWSLGRNMDGDVPAPEGSSTEQEGQRVVSVSALAMPSVFAYARERGAAPFSVALSTDGRLTVERYGRVIVEFTDEERLQLLLNAQVLEAA